MGSNTLAAVAEEEQRRCMFCGQALANRGEAYWDHLNSESGCHAAWNAWTERIDEDRVSGG